MFSTMSLTIIISLEKDLYGPPFYGVGSYFLDHTGWKVIILVHESIFIHLIANERLLVLGINSIREWQLRDGLHGPPHHSFWRWCDNYTPPKGDFGGKMRYNWSAKYEHFGVTRLKCIFDSNINGRLPMIFGTDPTMIAGNHLADHRDAVDM